MPDTRYTTIKILLEKKAISTFKDIFIYIPYTIVADDLRTNHNRMKEAITDPSLLKYREIIKLSELLDYDCKKLMLLAGLDVDRLMRDK